MVVNCKMSVLGKLHAHLALRPRKQSAAQLRARNVHSPIWVGGSVSTKPEVTGSAHDSARPRAQHGPSLVPWGGVMPDGSRLMVRSAPAPASNKRSARSSPY